MNRARRKSIKKNPTEGFFSRHAGKLTVFILVIVWLYKHVPMYTFCTRHFHPSCPGRAYYCLNVIKYYSLFHQLMLNLIYKDEWADDDFEDEEYIPQLQLPAIDVFDDVEIESHAESKNLLDSVKNNR